METVAVDAANLFRSAVAAVESRLAVGSNWDTTIKIFHYSIAAKTNSNSNKLGSMQKKKSTPITESMSVVESTTYTALMHRTHKRLESPTHIGTTNGTLAVTMDKQFPRPI